MAAQSCLHIRGLPSLPPVPLHALLNRSVADPQPLRARMAAARKHGAVASAAWQTIVSEARSTVRSAIGRGPWQLESTSASDVLVEAEDVERAFTGVVIVGDSQVRETGWALLQMMMASSHTERRRTLRYAADDPMLGYRRRRGLDVADLGVLCMPYVARVGFTFACSAGMCWLHSPFARQDGGSGGNESVRRPSEKMVRAPLYDNAAWDGKLRAVTQHACDGDFFISYQPSFGVRSFDPASLPACLRPQARRTVAGGTLHQRNTRQDATTRRPLLWIVNGGGLHAVNRCARARSGSADPQGSSDSWPGVVLSRYEPSGGDVLVWQPVGGGLLWEAASRCDFGREMRRQAASEAKWLRAHGRLHSLVSIDYGGLASDFLPLMADSAHFADWRSPCNQTFPEASALAAQLVLHAALHREPRVACPLHPGEGRLHPGEAKMHTGGTILHSGEIRAQGHARLHPGQPHGPITSAVDHAADDVLAQLPPGAGRRLSAGQLLETHPPIAPTPSVVAHPVPMLSAVAPAAMPSASVACLQAVGEGTWNGPATKMGPSRAGVAHPWLPHHGGAMRAQLEGAELLARHSQHYWRWRRDACGFGRVAPAEGRSLLRGRHLLFLGSSVVRRHMFAILDAILGRAAVRRRPGRAIEGSSASYDALAHSRNNSIFDRSCHGGIAVLIDLSARTFKLLSPGRLCNVPPAYTEHVYVAPNGQARASRHRIMRVTWRVRWTSATPNERGLRQALSSSLRKHGWAYCSKRELCDYHRTTRTPGLTLTTSHAGSGGTAETAVVAQLTYQVYLRDDPSTRRTRILGWAQQPCHAGDNGGEARGPMGQARGPGMGEASLSRRRVSRLAPASLQCVAVNVSMAERCGRDCRRGPLRCPKEAGGYEAALQRAAAAFVGSGHEWAVFSFAFVYEDKQLDLCRR